MSYNGWENRETWNASLWLNNEESLYRKAYAIANADGYCMMAKVEELAEFCALVWPRGKTPDGDDLDAVVWEDVISGLMEK